MTTLPHDIPDVMLAPVALHIDRRLDELANLDAKELAREVVIVTNARDDSPAARRSALLGAITYLADMHGWDLTWDPRGIRLRHGASSNTFVLGVPPVFADYING